MASRVYAASSAESADREISESADISSEPAEVLSTILSEAAEPPWASAETCGDVGMAEASVVEFLAEAPVEVSVSSSKRAGTSMLNAVWLLSRSAVEYGSNRLAP